MADKKISELTVLSAPAAGDLIPIVDVSEALAVNKNKYITYGNLTGVWTAYTPTLVGWAATPTVNCKYTMIGKTVIVYINVQAGTSNDTVATITAPTTMAAGTNYFCDGIMAYVVDNGTPKTTPCRYSLSQNENVINCYSDMGSGTWTASGTKRVRFTAIYEAA